MDKKIITRRAVLGTVVGGLAVAPFVTWSLRKGKEEEVVPVAYLDPEEEEFLIQNGYFRIQGDFFEQWKSFYDRFDAPFETESVTNLLVLKLDFSHSRNWHFLHLKTFVITDVSSLSDCAPDNLGTFDVTEGTISVGMVF